MKITDKILTSVSCAALKAAVTSAGLASHAGTYQEKEPEMLRKYSEKLGK